MKGIYQYKDLETGDIVYVGKDSHIDKKIRYYTHKSPSKYDEQQINRVIQNNINRYEYSVLYSSNDVSNDDLIMLEMTFIERYNPKFNFTKGGEGITGFKHSDESKQQISESMKGENNYWYGKNRSEETKQKISESKNTTGYLYVSKSKDKAYKQGFRWVYRYWEDGKQKFIKSVSLEKLKAKVKAKGLEWREL